MKALPETDRRYPGLRFVKADPQITAKGDPRSKDRIITDDDLAFNIFAPTPSPDL